MQHNVVEMVMDEHYYIYDDAGQPVATDVTTMARWLTDERRRLVFDKVGKMEVSTVFLGINHQWNEGPPVLWETMVFGLRDDMDEIQLRYTSQADAIKGHKRTCDEMRAVLDGRSLTRAYKRLLNAT